MMCKRHQTKPNKPPKLELEFAMCHDNISPKATNTAMEKQTIMVTAMRDPGASLSLVVRCMTMGMGITIHDLVKTTNRLVGANGGQIKLDSMVSLNPSIGNATSNQLVTSHMTCLFLSENPCKELCEVHPKFPAKATEKDQTKDTAMDSDNDNCGDCHTKPETPRRED